MAGIQQMQRAERKQQISQPKNFYFSRTFKKKEGSVQQLYVRKTALSIYPVVLFLKAV